ncbi:MAG TPA: hypothetical protein VGM76_04425 [Lacipirellulaceae bacterium]
MPDGQIIAGSRFPRFGASAACVMILLAYAAFNALFNPIGLPAAVNGWSYVIIGVLVMQPMLLAVWASLGPGAMATRIPLVFVAFMFVVFAGCYRQWNLLPMANNLPSNINWKAHAVLDVFEVAVPLAIFALTFVLAAVGGAIGQRRIAQIDSPSSANIDKSQFSLRYLLAMTAICAALLVMARPITFIFERPSSWTAIAAELIFGPLVLTIGLFFPLGISTIALTQEILTRRNLVVVAGAVAVTFVIAIATAAAVSGNFYDTLFALALVQLGAIMAGVLTAWTLRGARYRWVQQYAPDSGRQFLSERWL